MLTKFWVYARTLWALKLLTLAIAIAPTDVLVVLMAALVPLLRERAKELDPSEPAPETEPFAVLNPPQTAAVTSGVVQAVMCPCGIAVPHGEPHECAYIAGTTTNGPHCFPSRSHPGHLSACCGAPVVREGNHLTCTNCHDFWRV